VRNKEKPILIIKGDYHVKNNLRKWNDYLNIFLIIILMVIANKSFNNHDKL